MTNQQAFRAIMQAQFQPMDASDYDCFAGAAENTTIARHGEYTVLFTPKYENKAWQDYYEVYCEADGCACTAIVLQRH